MFTSSFHDIYFFEIKIFGAYNCFIKSLLKNPYFLYPSFLLPSDNVPEVGMWAKPLKSEYKNIQEVLTVIPFLPTLVS